MSVELFTSHAIFRVLLYMCSDPMCFKRYHIHATLVLRINKHTGTCAFRNKIVFLGALFQ